MATRPRERLRVPRTAKMGIAATLVLLTASSFGFRVDPGPGPRVADARPAPLAPPEIEWSGCVAVHVRNASITCIVEPGTRLRLWLQEAAQDVLVRVDGGTASVERYGIEGDRGTGLRVTIPDEATLLELRFASGATWHLPLARPEPPSAAFERAEARYLAAFNIPDTQELSRATAVLIDVVTAEGRWSDAIDMGLATVTMIQRLDHELANDWLQRLEPVASRYPKGRADLSAYRGVHAWFGGDIQTASALLRDAARHALHVEDEALGGDALPMYAETLAELGHFEESRRFAQAGLRIARTWASGSARSCGLGSVLRTVGWVNLLLRERQRTHDDPVPFLREAQAIFDDDGPCPQPDKVGGARLSLSWLALGEGKLDEALAHLRAIDRAPLRQDERVLFDDLATRLSLARGEPLARSWQRWKTLAQSARESGSPDALWRLHIRHGQLLERELESDAALEAYRRAEDALADLLKLGAVGVGRGEIAERYDESTSALVRLLLAKGRDADAFCVVREQQARRRSVAMSLHVLSATDRAAIEADLTRYRRDRQHADRLAGEADRLPRSEADPLRREAADLHRRADVLAHEIARTIDRLTPSPRCHELTPPIPDELLVGIYPNGPTWIVFGQDRDGVMAYTLAQPEPESSAWLEPMAAKLDAAGRIRVLAHRAAQAIDVGRLSWKGEPLGVRIPVSYGVELRSEPDDRPSDHRRAMLVGDATLTLEYAEIEIARMADRLHARGWSIATSGSFAGFDLFHYAGHQKELDAEGELWPPFAGGGTGPAASYLWLENGSRLTVHDVLATRPAPRFVVLAACRTGAFDLDGGDTSIALAFLVAGAHQVIATTAPIDDRESTIIGLRLAESLTRQDEIDLVNALHVVEREHDANENALMDYRVWVR